MPAEMALLGIVALAVLATYCTVAYIHGSMTWNSFDDFTVRLVAYTAVSVLATLLLTQGFTYLLSMGLLGIVLGTTAGLRRVMSE